MPMTMDELEDEIAIMLQTLFVEFKKKVVTKGIAIQFVIEKFGLIVCGFNRADYKFVDDNLSEQFPGWNVVYITPFDSVFDKKNEVIWELMRAGYMRWIRANFPNQFRQAVIVGGLDKKIIDERLRRWGDSPKYKYFVDENKRARQNSSTYVLSQDPGFFDYMP